MPNDLLPSEIGTLIWALMASITQKRHTKPRGGYLPTTPSAIEPKNPFKWVFLNLLGLRQISVAKLLQNHSIVSLISDFIVGGFSSSFNF